MDVGVGEAGVGVLVIPSVAALAEDEGVGAETVATEDVEIVGDAL